MQSFLKYFYLLSFTLIFISCKKESSDFIVTPGEQSSATETPQSFNQEFLEIVNHHREGLGLRPLILNLEMSMMAREHSANMASGNVSFGHLGFSTRCDEARKIVGGGNLCAENVAMGQQTPQALFDAWIDSPKHRANLEEDRVSVTGIGYFKSSKGPYYWTQIYLEN